jgi:phage-related protein
MMDYGMGLDEAMKSLGTTMDLAAGKQVDLETAAKAVGRAFEGNASMLTRMGVEVTKSKDDSVVFADAMTKLQEKFGGAAQKDLETYAGKQTQVANAMDNLKEKIGGALLPVLSSFQDMMGNVVKGADALVTDLGKAWEAFSEIPEVKKIAESLSGAWTDMQKGMGQVADELGKTLMPLFKELWTALGDVWKALSPVIDSFGEVWTAIVGVGKDGKEAYTIFNLIGDILKITIVPALTALVEGIKLVTPLIGAMATAFKTGIETILFWIDKLNAAFETIKKAAQGVSEFFTNLWSGLTGQTTKGVSEVTAEVKKGTNQITSAFDDLKKEVSSESIWPDMWGNMVSQTRGGFDEILSETARRVGQFQGMFGGAALGLAGPGSASSLSPAAVGAPSRTNVTVYSSVGTLAVGNKSELDDYLKQVYRTVVDAVRAQ